MQGMRQSGCCVTVAGDRVLMSFTAQIDGVPATLGVGQHGLDANGPRFDAFVAELIEARSRARRAALLQWTGTPEVAAFTQAPASPGDTPVGIHVFADGFTVEPWTGAPQLVPFGLVRGVSRDGYRFTFRLRGAGGAGAGDVGASAARRSTFRRPNWAAGRWPRGLCPSWPGRARHS